ncbi:MAG: TRAP transporter small permease subunit [Desulfotignum sp.]|nr:TRAP transporter small permease subunit [Desulfotignum sp.]
MEKIRAAVRLMDGLCSGVAKSVKWLILFFVVVTIFDVALRYFFQAPTLWARELVARLFGPLWMLTGAYLLTKDEQVRMDLVFMRLSTRQKAILDLITFTLFFLYFGIMVFYAWKDWWSCYTMAEQSRSVWRPVLWPFKLAIPLGISLLLIAGIAKYIRDLYVAITGRDWNGN